MDSTHGNVNLDNGQVLLSPSKKSKQDEENTDSSSSSSDSSSGDIFLKPAAEGIFKSTADIGHIPSAIPQLISKHGGDAHLASTIDVQDGEKGIVKTKFGVGNPSEEGSMISRAITNCDLADNVGLLGLEKQPPPVQAMGRSDVPDPNRIPSSVFARTKSTTPMEWSVASNESLFSIHMGNSSFSRDHVFLVGRSQELSFPPSPPRGVSAAPTVASHDMKSLDSRERLEVSNVRVVSDGRIKEEMPSPVGVPRSPSVSRRSDGSATSTNSFAFPILAHRRSGSVEGESEHHRQHQPQPEPQPQPQPQPQLQPQNPEAAPVAAPQGKWFSCFSCCTFCS